MNRILLIIIPLFFIAWTYEPTQINPNNRTFKEGEFVKMRIHYGLINAGFATLEVSPEIKTVNGRPCYYLIGKGFSNKFFDKFYKVRDTYESFFDVEQLVSHKFLRTTEEGHYSNYTETHFDHKNKKAKYVDRHKNEKFFPIPDGIQDVISAYYYARMNYDAKDLQVGDRLDWRNFIDRKTVNLEAVVLKKEVIKVSGKKFKTIKLKMTVEESGMITDGANLFLWVSDDENKIPIRFKSKLLVGSIKADIISWENLMHPLDAYIEK